MAEVRRILAVKLSALGDLFHAVPVIHRLKEHYGCPVDWVTQPEYVELAGCHRDVERVIAYPRRGGLRAWGEFVRELRQERYDLAVDLQGLTKSGLAMGLARAGRKLAPSGPRELCKWFAHEVPEARAPTPHAMDRLFDTLRHLGIAVEPVEYPLTFPEVPPLPGGRPRVAVAPRSRWPAKDWPEERFVEVLRCLRGRREVEVFVLGGPADRELGQRMVTALGARTHSLCGSAPLLSLGGVLRQMDVLLCNDSGPMHFAAAVGTPLVALFGPTDPALTGPWGGGHTVLRPPPGPEGYPPHRSYKDGDRSFIARITVEEVLAALEGVLDGGVRGGEGRAGRW